MLNYNGILERELTIRGVYFEPINTAILTDIFAQIEENNMDMILLEKLPKIAVYSPPDKQPWDDAVTLALRYAEIDYEVVFDEEVLTDKNLSRLFDCPIRVIEENGYYQALPG